MYTWNDGSTLQHHDIKGQKWGIRRFQNPDGSLTAEGYNRYYGVNNKQEAFNRLKDFYDKNQRTISRGTKTKNDSIQDKKNDMLDHSIAKHFVDQYISSSDKIYVNDLYSLGDSAYADRILDSLSRYNDYKIIDSQDGWYLQKVK